MAWANHDSVGAIVFRRIPLTLSERSGIKHADNYAPKDITSQCLIKHEELRAKNEQYRAMYTFLLEVL